MTRIASQRRYAHGALAALSLATVISASACTPAQVSVFAGTHSSTAATTGVKPATTAPMPVYGPYDTHLATPHVVKAPASLGAYPWANDQTGGNDPYGQTKRQCVSYAAWFINSHGTPFGYYTQGPKGVGVFTDASTWASAAQQAGFTVSTVPVVGSIAQWGANETSTWSTGGGGYSWFTAGGDGHVAIVTGVYPNGNVNIAQYNMGDSRSFSTLNNVRAPRYIYIPLSSPHVS